ncbi:MAG: family 43 glycosylhydrolase [Lachnospiraceae bacterium]|nr:family 43 glycosylhydrolase [Lachnospiraceae bacterium]
MANPFLPLWEYIPDGEPRVFGDRVYIYGSHDNAGSDSFCDYKLKVWSAPVDDLNNWTCHGDIFHTRPDRDHPSDTDWTDNPLYAPDVVEKDGTYYLYCYILWNRGCVAVADKPEGPFRLLSQYKYDLPDNLVEEGAFVDPGVLVDDDGRVYIYCGFERSYMAELKDNMYEVIPESYKRDIILADKESEKGFFEACSIRKVGSTYYLIYSPNKGNRLEYMTSGSPSGPFSYRGTIIDNGINYPAGNNHGSICNINGQWYIFYHRMTNATITSRRACVERIEILPDGTIPQVEMTSLGFETSLNPYKITNADIACVLKGGCFVTEFDPFTRVITSIKSGCVIGYKYFDFGEDYSSETMEFAAKVNGSGCSATIKIFIDGEEGTEIGSCKIGSASGCYTSVVKNVTGRHSVFFQIEHNYEGWFVDWYKDRQLFELESFVFMK